MVNALVITLEVEDMFANQTTTGCTDFEYKTKNNLLVVDHIESVPEDYYDFIYVPFDLLDRVCKNCFEIITVVNNRVIIRSK